MDKLTELQNDILYLAKRYKIIEDAFLLQEKNNAELVDALQGWTQSVSTQFEFMFKEFASLHNQLHKHKKSYNYFRESLKEKFKTDYEKFESLFLKVKQLFAKEESY